MTKANDKIFGVYKGLGDAYSALEKREPALGCYQKALALRPMINISRNRELS